MKNMEEWFAEQDFDNTALPSGHRERFLARLEEACETSDDQNTDQDIQLTDSDGLKEGHRVITMNPWFKWSLVAGFVVLLGIAGLNITPAPINENGLSSISPEMAQAQDFFTTTINLELEKLNKEQSPATERIIADTKSALNKLESDYKNIKADFNVNGDSKAVIAAMIQNFQNRIDLLQTALEQIEQLKTFKEKENETII